MSAGATGETAGDAPATPPGLEHVRRMWAQDRASAHLGIELLDVGVEARDGIPLGRARTRMRVTGTMVNGHDIAHGGFVFALADSTFALACNATGRTTVAAGCDITYVAAGRLDDVLVAEARERITYGRSGITDVTVTREDGAVVAEFRGRSRALSHG
ncbi:hydroxyphenylacetyl-CoA thioesterase PaaI [Ornithinimicrobium sp. W1665]|uniref:hydroxyphenylacetyl-CoA thioesterase PaaI n=1 Tax=Ornithinimicrobium sp. W1665 TaxID=3416666 RepID=UPI003CF8D75B